MCPRNENDMNANTTKKSTNPGNVEHATERLNDTPAQEAAAATDSEATPEEEVQWSRGSDLAAPPPRPGYVQCWIRTMLGGEADAMNIARSMSPGEGWKPRLASTVSQGIHAPTLQHGSYGEVIGVAGMILCERPKRMQEQKDAYDAAVLRQQRDSIDRDITKVQRAGHPIQQVRKTSVGGAPVPAAFADDNT